MTTQEESYTLYVCLQIVCYCINSAYIKSWGNGVGGHYNLSAQLPNSFECCPPLGTLKGGVK